MKQWSGYPISWATTSKPAPSRQPGPTASNAPPRWSAGPGAEGAPRAVVARKLARRRPPRAVLFLHGWSDYFFNEELAGLLDPARLRVLRPGHAQPRAQPARRATHGGYVADLDDYDAEITAALGIIAALHPEAEPPPTVALMGHSTGGLIAALWASRHPGLVSQLILDSPWLEMHGSPAVRRAARTMVEPLARFRPEAVIRLPERSFYWRSISSAAEGEWTLDDNYRPPRAFPVRAGWLSAVLVRAGAGGAGTEDRRAHPGADFRGQRQRDVLEGIHAAHRRGPGRQHHRPARPQPGPHRHPGADRRRPARRVSVRPAASAPTPTPGWPAGSARTSWTTAAPPEPRGASPGGLPGQHPGVRPGPRGPRPPPRRSGGPAAHRSRRRPTACAGPRRATACPGRRIRRRRTARA